MKTWDIEFHQKMGEIGHDYQYGTLKSKISRSGPPLPA